jgi:hypothetical protein
MNVLQEIPGVQKVNTGGFVSPSGASFIGNFTEEQVLTIQRIVLDEKIVNAAERAGATLQTNTEVNVSSFFLCFFLFWILLQSLYLLLTLYLPLPLPLPLPPSSFLAYCFQR